MLRGSSAITGGARRPSRRRQPAAAARSESQVFEALRTMMTGEVIDGGSHPFSSRDVDASGAMRAPGLPAAFTAGFARLAAGRRGRRRRRLIVPSRTA